MNEDTLDLLENRLIIEHSTFGTAKSEILRYIQYGRRDEIISVMGPSGIGKSTLQSYSVNYLVDRMKDGWRSDSLPPLRVEAPAAYDGKFPWRAFLEDILTCLGEDNLNSKVDLDLVDSYRLNGKKLPHRSKLSIAQLESLIRKRVKALRPVAILIDESQNLVENVSTSECHSNLVRLKNWCNTLDTKIILFGTHEASLFLNLNEQLSRRITPVYFPRYRKDNPNDMESFSLLYLNLIHHLGLNIDSRIHQNFYQIYDYTLGVPGLLATWLHKSISFCIERNLKKITPAIFKQNRSNVYDLTTAEQAIKNFELYQAKANGDFNPDMIFADDDIEQGDLFTRKNSPQSKAGRKKPGKQNPRRHKVRED